MIILSFDVGIKNLAYCQIDSFDKSILDWFIVDCSSDNNYVLKIITELDSIGNLLESDIILIEKQPSFNPKMRIISTVIYVYFTLRLQHELNKKIKIMYYSPKNKLKLCNELDIIKNKSTSRNKKDKRNNYLVNKKAAIQQTQILLNNSPFLQYFNSHKKKDDLADSYLQGISYIN